MFHFHNYRDANVTFLSVEVGMLKMTNYNE